MPLSTRPLTVYRHTQSTPSSTWTIVHGHNSYPVIDLFVTIEGAVQKIIPVSVTYVDANTAQVAFSIPRTGFATVVI